MPDQELWWSFRVFTGKIALSTSVHFHEVFDVSSPVVCLSKMIGSYFITHTQQSMSQLLWWRRKEAEEVEGRWRPGRAEAHSAGMLTDLGHDGRLCQEALEPMESREYEQATESPQARNHSCCWDGEISSVSYTLRQQDTHIQISPLPRKAWSSEILPIGDRLGHNTI